MNKEKKLEILNRLTKEGHITLDEALVLLETEKEYIYIPSNNWPYQPLINPSITPDWTYRPGQVMYYSGSSFDNFLMDTNQTVKTGTELYPIIN